MGIEVEEPAASIPSTLVTTRTQHCALCERITGRREKNAACVFFGELAAVETTLSCRAQQ